MARFVPPSYPVNVMNGNDEKAPAAREELYEIRLQGCLDEHWTSWFEGLRLTADPKGGETVIEGRMPDQCALHSVLRKIHDLGLTLISVLRKA